MKIFGWSADNAACHHYRIKLPLDALAARGHEVAYGGRMPAQWRDEADIIVAQRTCMDGPSRLYQALAREGRAKLVFEMDDDLFSIWQGHNKHARFFHLPEVRRALVNNLRAAHLVTVTTEALAEVCGRHNSNVVILPNYLHSSTLDIPIPDRRIPPGDGHCIIGWGGSATHDKDWLVAKQAVAKTLTGYDHTRMRFLGNGYPDGLPPDRLEFRQWTQDMREHYQRVARFDIGLAPLVDTTFNRSKSWLKVAEYMCLGVPAVAAGTPDYARLIDNGTTGFIARKSADWERILRELTNDAELRAVVGQQARKKAAAELTIESNVERWEQAYASLL